MLYCHGHARQLIDGDTIKAIKIIRGSLDAAFELTKVIKYSVLKMIGEKNTLQKGKELPAGYGKTMQQETLVTQYYDQIVVLSEGHCHKAF